ncbi:hypothetical protein EUA06_11195 [Nocardioides glacieisoli]|uniref:Uncharacterized protein n=1 Tax=Nocardioides glacieisoli TaxID=1168730 RepID=A0A4Q2RSD7_9ACTN|nr:hypothetical protein [Nocardioides glacieisoli]RYB90834.1 hypothetical protein EUA06_11195 [Nocardioides glacieisoli]
MTHQHGEYQPGRGFYDRSLKGWVSDPGKLTPTSTPAPTPTQGQRDEVASWGRKTFKPNPELEQMLRLRDSDKREQRETYERLAFGQRRVQVADYETRRSAAINAGEWEASA